jgi:GGDEF domain-containing protein
MSRRGAEIVDQKLEVVVVLVLDVDRAKQFNAKLGWRPGTELPR